ncbi:MAG: hypothetical protein GY839_06035 [candidate division Zixibacteria bacterium]|nr:hypothetical protein [candidate division Zixibacteria bacterium]
MLTNGLERGFTPEILKKTRDPRISRDDDGYYIFTASENIKVYINLYYKFLEKSEKRALMEYKIAKEKVESTSEEHEETLAYYRARKIILEQLLKNIYKYYADSTNSSSLMTPWCFGTIVLEKIEIYRDKISKGQVHDSNIPEYPFYVLQYIDETYKKSLLDLFDFPEKAFSMRWQYTELLKRYSKVLSDVTNSLQNVLQMIKSYGH